MNTTDPKPKKKKTLTQQLAELQESHAKLAVDREEEIEKRKAAEREVQNILIKKDKEMKDILRALATPLYAQDGQPPRMYNMDQFMGRSEPSVQQLAGDLAGGIARLAEKNNLQQAIIEENDSQITWFRELIEKAFGVRVKPPKVEPANANPENNHEPKKK